MEETGRQKGDLSRRFQRYSEKVFGLRSHAEHLRDGRRHAQVSTLSCFLAVFFMFASFERSLNSLEERLRDPLRRRRWNRLCGTRPPSADTIGYCFSRFDLDSLRAMIHHLYTVLQRNHHVARLRVGNLRALSVDGHELFASYLRACPWCSQRIVHTKRGDRIQFYHRVVVAEVVAGTIALPLDVEPILPGEDEIAAALRLLERIHERYPKLYHVLTGDSLYANPNVLKFVRARGKHLLAVLKENHPDLLRDALALCDTEQSVEHTDGTTRYERWDIEGFSSWWQVDEKVRVVRSRETKQKAGALTTSDWLWVTTMKGEYASTETVWNIGHSRWDIENDCLNYMSEFFLFNLKPPRRRISMRGIIAEIATAFWASLNHVGRRDTPSKPP